MKTKKCNKQKKGGIPPFILFAAIGVAVGYLLGGAIEDSSFMDIAFESPLTMGLTLLVVYVASLMQIVAHELGHLVFGLMSGYRFVSFRVGHWMLAAQEDGLRLRKYTVVGTGGQCLMLPPALDENGHYPTVLYNLGGSAFNLLFTALSVLLAPLLPSWPYLQMFVWSTALIGMAFCLTNAIPLKVGGIANDGYNAILLRKNPAAARAFWLQLQVNGLMTQGMPLHRMPAEWFEMPDPEGLKDPLICGRATLCPAYHHSKGDFAKAEELTRYLLQNAPGMLEIHRNELRCDLLFYELIGPCRRQYIDELYTKALQRYIKQTQSYLGRCRLQYAYALLGQSNHEQAETAKARFEKVAKSYPYQGEVAQERQLMELILQKAETKEQIM